MSRNSNFASRTILNCACSALAILSAQTAFAQTTPVPPAVQPSQPTTTDEVNRQIESNDATPGTLAVPASDPSAVADSSSEDIVVTGTLLRGIAPTGTNVIGVSRDDITATGAASTNDLLATVPQLGSFNTIPAAGGTINGIVRPNIRQIGTSGSSTTLVVVNGHRLVGAGILQTTPDPSVIAPGAIERVEVIPDGGSSIYGSEAIGGVINFITRRRFDGIEANARYGMADGYDTVDATLTAGRDWGSGSAFVSYSYAWHNNISRGERDYAASFRPDKGGSDFRSTACTPGNITVAGVSYALPGRAPGQNRCDITEAGDIYPREKRHNVFASVVQELTDDIELQVHGYYSLRKATFLGAQSVATGTITSANPYFQRIGTETSQSVAFGFTDVFGPSVITPQKFSSYGWTPSLTWKFGSGWQARLQGNFGRSYNETNEDQLNPVAIGAALAGTTTATALNPYNPGASNPTVLAGIENYVLFSGSTQHLGEGRLVVDGPLATLPGGDVRLAVGGEVSYTNIFARVYTGRRRSGDQTFTSDGDRTVKSLFAEVFVPIVGADNGTTLLRKLDLSASVRRDDYNDVGATTNPKIGINYSPVDGIVLRGNYGTSFNAPSLADSASLIDTRVQVSQNSTVLQPGAPAGTSGRTSLLLAGGNANLTPEEATTYSFGADLKPKFLPQLAASVTYFNIDYRNIISLIPFNNAATLFGDPAYASFYIINPTLAQLQALIPTTRIEGAASIASLYENGRSPYLYRDARRYNLGRIKLDGIDFNVAFNQPTSFGAINASVSGSYILNRDARANSTAAYISNLDNGTRSLSLVGTLGAKVGNFTARSNINHGGSYPVLNTVNQTRVKSYTTVDLFFGYDIGGEGMLKGTSLSLNVDNVFDQDPPFFNNATGYANGSTFGRLFTLGIRKKF